MGTRMIRVMGFLPAIFSFLSPSILDLGSGTGQTERRTEWSSMHVPSAEWGRGKMQNDLNKLAECDKREEMQNDRAAWAVHIDTTEISSDRDRVFTICHT